MILKSMLTQGRIYIWGGGGLWDHNSVGDQKKKKKVSNEEKVKIKKNRFENNKIKDKKKMKIVSRYIRLFFKTADALGSWPPLNAAPCVVERALYIEMSWRPYRFELKVRLYCVYITYIYVLYCGSCILHCILYTCVCYLIVWKPRYSFGVFDDHAARK